MGHGADNRETGASFEYFGQSTFFVLIFIAILLVTTLS